MFTFGDDDINRYCHIIIHDLKKLKGQEMDGMDDQRIIKK